MTDWRPILFVSYLAVILSILWVITIKDVVKHLGYLKSQKVTSRGANDKYHDNKKPNSVGMVKAYNSPYCLESRYQKDNDSNSSQKSYPHRAIRLFAHTRIIKSWIAKCNKRY